MTAPFSVMLVQFLQAVAPQVAQPLPAPDIESAVSLWSVLSWSALNPATLAVAWLMGSRADQPAKLGIAAFAGAVAGIALMWISARLHLSIAVDTARAAAGVFVTSLPIAFFCAWLSRRIQNSRR